MAEPVERATHVEFFLRRQERQVNRYAAGVAAFRAINEAIYSDSPANSLNTFSRIYWSLIK